MTKWDIHTDTPEILRWERRAADCTTAEIHSGKLLSTLEGSEAM